MARVCQVTGKKPITGHKVCFSNKKSKRRWISMKVSSDAIRTINKRGLFVVVSEMREKGVAI
jgi:large subunit ribosomal protein L28